MNPTLVWFLNVVSGASAGAIAAMFMEAYYQRRATEEVHDHDTGLE